MKILQKICFVLLLGTFSSVYGGDCYKDNDLYDCVVKAEQGDGIAQAALGLIFVRADQGYSQAQYRLGYMYYEGLLAPQDNKEAIKWFRRSADQGYSKAQYSLGLVYDNGEGVVQDYKEAVKWYRKSAEQGFLPAQYNLGVKYFNGKGVVRDYVMAHMYWNIVAVSGYKNAIKYRGIVEKKMTSLQIAEAQKLAREWMRTH
jgi:uncharacterized protein